MIARVHEVYLEAVQCILVAVHCVSFDFPNFLFGPLDANQRLQTRRAASENSWKTLSGLNKSAAARLLPRLKCPQKHDPLSYFCNIREKNTAVDTQLQAGHSRWSDTLGPAFFKVEVNSCFSSLVRENTQRSADAEQLLVYRAAHRASLLSSLFSLKYFHSTFCNIHSVFCVFKSTCFISKSCTTTTHTHTHTPQIHNCFYFQVHDVWDKHTNGSPAVQLGFSLSVSLL